MARTIDMIQNAIEKIKEASSRFMDSRKDFNFRELLDARQELDSTFVRLQEQMQKPFIQEEAQLQILLKRIIDRIETIYKFRAQIDNKQVSIQDMYAYYNAFEEELLQVIQGISEYIIEPDNIRLFYAYMYITQVQNAAGLERQILQEAIASHKLTSKQEIKLLNVINEQDVAYAAFNQILNADDRTLFRNALLGIFSDENTKTRIEILKTMHSDEKAAVNLANWEKTENDRIDKLNGLGNTIFDTMITRNLTTIQSEKQKQIAVGILLIAVLFLTLLLGWIISRSITEPLKNAVKLANQVSAGNLQEQYQPSMRKDEIGQLESALCRMVGNLRNLKKNLQEEIDLLASSASEISNSVTEVSTGTAETATAVTETTTTVEELRQTGQLSSEKAREVQVSSVDALNILKQCESSIETTINDMAQIESRMSSISESIIKLSEHGQVIGSIIDTVNDLAEQSNLLAVNAAIEAAKAGDQGKGFGVVALEVRRLAEQSKQATVQVRAILQDIQNATGIAVMATEQGSKAVTKGVVQSRQTNDAIKILSTGVGKVADYSSQISISSQQQLIGVEQVTVAMNNIKHASNQHVDHMRQIEQAVYGLNKVGLNLKEIIATYRL